MKTYAALLEAARHVEAFDDLLERRDIAALFLNLAQHYLAHGPAVVMDAESREVVASRNVDAALATLLAERVSPEWLDFLRRERRAVLLPTGEDNPEGRSHLYLVPFLFGWELVGYAVIAPTRSTSAGQEEVIRILARATASAWGRVRQAVAIRLERDRAEGLFESIVSPLIVVAPDGKVTRTNAAARTVLEVEDLIGRHYADLFGFTMSDPVAGVLASGEAIHRIDAPGRDGRLWGVTVSPFAAADAAKAVVVGFRDLSEYRRFEEKLSAAERQATIGRMAATVAHEVNNPLGAVRAQLRLLKRRCEPDPDATKKLSIIENQLERIERTVRVMLTFSRHRSVHHARVRLAQIVETVIDLFAGGFQEKGIALRRDLPEDLPEIELDVDQVQEVLVNLLENARDALGKGRNVCVAARLFDAGVEDTRVEDASVVIVVEDDGPGLGEDPERVFEPFYTTKTTGTGLGLSIARRICETHGGTLTGENRPEGGARFRAVIPATR